MASSLVKINVHIIFHVKSTSAPMRTSDLTRIFSYIGGILKNIGSIPIAIGGMPDHIHILSSLPSNMSISDMVRIVKTESCRWIKTLDDYYECFSWQSGYGAFSVSPSILERTANYIMNQAEHHKARTFIEEYKTLLSAYGIPYDERYAFSD
jgi:REP element-mobilizing transposase RayT